MVGYGFHSPQTEVCGMLTQPNQTLVLSGGNGGLVSIPRSLVQFAFLRTGG